MKDALRKNLQYGPGSRVSRQEAVGRQRHTVVASSLISKKAGVRAKTDRREAQNLLRKDMKELERPMKPRLSAFLLRNGCAKPEKLQNWIPQYFNCLKDLKFSQQARHIVFQEDYEAVVDCEKIVAQAITTIERAQKHNSLAYVVKALMGLGGVDVTTQFTVMAKPGDLSRFARLASSWPIWGSSRTSPRSGLRPNS